mmetsp:Transcript_15483/g.31099  ORF Transcript_15483/g.31099 Transcript_15483/m.31099 type:complete len:168 (+) Transcript_15483:281-784(+)
MRIIRVLSASILSMTYSPGETGPSLSLSTHNYNVKELIVVPPVQGRLNTGTRKPGSLRKPSTTRCQLWLYGPRTILFQLFSILSVSPKPRPSILQNCHCCTSQSQSHRSVGSCHTNGFTKDVTVGPRGPADEGSEEVIGRSERAESLVNIWTGVDNGIFGVTKRHGL